MAATLEQKIKALMNYLNEEEDLNLTEDNFQQGYNEDIIKVALEDEDREYFVSDYDTAYDKAVERTEDLLEDVGFTVVNGWEQFVGEDWFEDAFREMEENYVYDIEDENDDVYENRLISELVDRGLLDEDDDFHFDEEDVDQEYPLLNDDVNLEEKKEEYVDAILDGINDFVEEFLFEFGEEEFNKVCKDYGLVDLRELAEYCVNSDGIANELASYDGYELALGDDLYAYRQD